MKRRDFGFALMGGLTAALLPLRMAKAMATPKKRFIFVIARGGWDPLLTLAPMFQASAIQMPPESSPASIGGIPLTDSAMRPSVRSFFEQHAAKSLIIHGLSVRSVAHDVCETTMLTGSATGSSPDHATRLAASSSVALPHLVVEGPSLPGELAPLVTRTGRAGQLQALVDGSIMERADVATSPLSRPTRELVDGFLARRLAAFADTSPRLGQEALEALSRKRRIEQLRGEVSFATDGSIESQIELAVSVLGADIAQCVTISPPISWDSHTDSDNQQTQYWEALFLALSRLMSRLAATPSPGTTASSSLAEDTVVVCLSEMSRTPRLNADQGRDHWPWTSALLVGPGLTGGRAVGGYDANYSGLGIDPATGETDPNRAATSPAQLGATLLALADLDASVFGPRVEPLLGVLT